MSKRKGTPRKPASGARSLVEREAAVRVSERAIARRLKAADERDVDLRAEKQAVKAGVDATAFSAAQLREANERLVVATVNAQTMTEVAQQATAQVSYMAEHDFLTGLANRALLTDRLTQSISLAQRHDRRVALMYLDLDHFKHINDSLGHAVGDQLLQSTAQRLLGCVRASDTVSRQGGDEFVVVFPESDLTDAIAVCEQFLDAIQSSAFAIADKAFQDQARALQV